MAVALGFALGRWTAPVPLYDDSAQTLIAAPLGPAESSPTVATDQSSAQRSVAAPIAVWENRWRTLVDLPGSPQRDEALATLLEERARLDAAGALAIAATESNRLRREKFRHAALRGWAAHAPDSAADWVAMNLSQPERDAAISAVIEGVASVPEAAASFVERLILGDPLHAYEYGHTCIRALAARGEFPAAAQFATSGVLQGSSRTEWINGAFSSWAQHQPKSAAQAALALTDSDSRLVALAGVIAGWAPAEPAGLAEFSLQLPNGPERTAALAESLRHWVMQDPVSASAWINRLESSAEIDAGAAAVATLQPLIANRPDVAIGWAESIVEPNLRRQTLGAVLQTWSLADRAAAQRYLDAHPGAVEQMVISRAEL